MTRHANTSHGDPGKPHTAINLQQDEMRSSYFHRKWPDGHASVNIQKVLSFYPTHSGMLASQS